MNKLTRIRSVHVLTFRRLLRLAGCVLLASGGGCAAVTNPVADAIPARRVPAELLEPSKASDQTIPLSLLGQPKPPVYRIDAGDVLGIYVEGFLGERNPPDPLPIHVGPLVQARDVHRLSPAAGYPVPVDDDGTIALPGAGSLSVRGLSVPEARDAVRDYYVSKKLLKADTSRVIVTMLTPRQYQVVVMRQESASFAVTTEGTLPASKRGTGNFVDLIAYQNDVLHALAETGGLPGLDAVNEVVIYRGFFRPGTDRAAVLANVESRQPLSGGEIVRIPLRRPCGTPAELRPEDVILQTGDVVFLEARKDDLFFTGGLLPPGAYVLPRDRDLDVLEAVSRVRGPFYNGAFGVSNLAGNQVQPGLGGPSPSLLAVIRRTPTGGQVPIVVDLREALLHPEERLIVRSGDILILQEKPGEAMVRYFSQTFMNFEFVWKAFSSQHTLGIVDTAAPDRLSPQLPTVNIVK
jgi:protein involved in polysaccharide export with SLBB domain